MTPFLATSDSQSLVDAPRMNLSSLLQFNVAKYLLLWVHSVWLLGRFALSFVNLSFVSFKHSFALTIYCLLLWQHSIIVPIEH